MDDNERKPPKERLWAHDPLADLDWETAVTPTPTPPTPDPLDDFALDDALALLASDFTTELPPLVEEEAILPPPNLDDLIFAIDQEFAALSQADLLDIATPDATPNATEQYILFSLADVEYCVPISNVLEIGRPLDMTRVPNVPFWMRGVANLRGDIISLVDLRTFLDLPADENISDGRLLIAHSHTEDITIGLLVDRINGIANLQTHHIGAPTAPIEDQVAPYLRGVYDYNGRLLVILNLDKLLLSPEMQQFENMN